MVHDALGSFHGALHFAKQRQRDGIENGRFAASGRAKNTEYTGAIQAGEVDFLFLPVALQSREGQMNRFHASPSPAAAASIPALRRSYSAFAFSFKSVPVCSSPCRASASTAIPPTPAIGRMLG